MRLQALLVRRVPPVPSPVLVEVAARLRALGHHFDEVIPEESIARSDRLAPDYDLYLLKSHTELALSLAAALAAQGARLLNPYPGCASAQDKVVSMRRLSIAGVPVPPTWVTMDLAHLADRAERTPLIVKPHRGHRGAGIAIVRSAEALLRLPPPATPVVIQELVDGPGQDLKLYVVGDQVFGVRKPFSEQSFTVPGRPCPVPAAVRDLALRAGVAFGLGLYGLDVVESPDGPVVVDLNYFPGYKGVPDVAPLIAEYVHGYATGRHELPYPAVVDSAAAEPEVRAG